MTIGGDALAEFRLTRLGAPALGEADEEPLIAAQAVEHGIRFPLQRQTIGVIGRQEPGYIGDIFAESLMSVDRKIGKRLVHVELRRKRFAGGLEMIEVFLRPPVDEAALRIEL